MIHPLAGVLSAYGMGLADGAPAPTTTPRCWTATPCAPATASRARR
jgi:hypothetical protein